MDILSASRYLPLGLGPFAVGIGIFDGVHIGHQALLHRVIACAHRDGIRSLAYTFDPHPVAVLRPDKAAPLIEPLSTRLERFAQLGLSAALVETFDHMFASIEATQFITDVLVKKLQARHVIVGSGFTFGKGQAGDVALLTALGKQYGYTTHPVPHVMLNEHKVSSTAIRQCIQHGDMAQAQRMLGRYYTLTGHVVHGAKRGRTIGFPTANVVITNALQPASGVYAAWAHSGPGTPLGCTPQAAVVNIGYAPTFGEGQHRIEVHLLNYAGDSLYDQTLHVHLVQRLRSEMTFAGIDALKGQIAQDVVAARHILQTHPPLSMGGSSPS